MSNPDTKPYRFFTEELNNLKEIIAGMEEDLKRAKIVLKEVIKNYDIVEEENEQLKKRNMELQTALDSQNKIVLPFPPEVNADTDFEELKFHPNYEIGRKYPYPIRKKDDKKVIKDIFKKTVYVGVKIDGKDYLKHRIIALQWIENDDPKNKKEVDHIDRNTFNYKKENLRWVTRSENNSNRSGYRGDFELIPELPDNCREIISYNKHTLNEIYYDGENLYRPQGPWEFRKLQWKNRKDRNTPVIKLVDSNKKDFLIFKNKLDKMLLREDLKKVMTKAIDFTNKTDDEEEDITEPDNSE